MGWSSADWEEPVDPALLDDAISACCQFAKKPTDDGSVAAIDALGLIVERGLIRREGRLVRSPLAFTPALLDDWWAWRIVSEMFESLGGSLSDASLVVCAGCTVVFDRKVSDYCGDCSRRAPQPIEPANLRRVVNGERVTASMPTLSGSLITGWQTKVIGRCQECGDLMYARSDAVVCPQKRCQRRRDRRAA